ncbi:unnamed protein product, partial [Vitis vinifera]
MIIYNIMTLNSSKLRTPSPLRSNCEIMTVHSSMLRDSPSLLSILFKLFGVMQPHPSFSYILNASFKSFILSSSSTPSTSLTKSPNSNNPSPSESSDSSAASASSSVIPSQCP